MAVDHVADSGVAGVMTLELALIIVLAVVACGQAALSIAISAAVVRVGNRLKDTENTLAKFMKEDMRLHDTVQKRINTIERKVNNANAVTLPKYETALRDLHDRQTAATMLWADAADEALRNFEKECGE